MKGKTFRRLLLLPEKVGEGARQLHGKNTFFGGEDRHKLFYLNSFSMDSKQVGKAILVILSYTTLGIEPRTFSYPWSFTL